MALSIYSRRMPVAQPMRRSLPHRSHPSLERTTAKYAHAHALNSFASFEYLRLNSDNTWRGRWHPRRDERARGSRPMAHGLDRFGVTQQRLLRALLLAPDSMGVEELGQRLSVTHNAVRQHLTVLTTQGVCTQNTATRNRGGSQTRYVITPAGRDLFPRNYDAISAALVLDSTRQPWTSAHNKPRNLRGLWPIFGLAWTMPDACVVGPPGLEPGTKGFALPGNFLPERTISSPSAFAGGVRDARACHQGH